MPAKDIAGLAGAVAVIATGVRIFAEVVDSAGTGLQIAYAAALTVAAALLAVAAVMHVRAGSDTTPTATGGQHRRLPGARRSVEVVAEDLGTRRVP